MTKEKLDIGRRVYEHEFSAREAAESSRFLDSPGEACKSVAKESHPMLQPVNPLIAEPKHFLSCHGGVRTEYLGLYAAWVAFKSSVREGKIKERIALLESYCFQTRATFRVKDRYDRKKRATVL